MIVGVSIGAYAAGLFHLMTHAFFKALLFMAAGSVIAAMAGTQNIDRMGGFRRAMPFTSALLIVGALALAAFPGTVGILLQGRDPRLRRRARRLLLDLRDRRLHRRLPDRLLRLPDRLPGRLRRAVPEARELEQGHLAHAEPQNPLTGEHEDTDVGFPGAEHHIAERDVADAVAMAVLGFGAIFGGLSRSRASTTCVDKFLAPTFDRLAASTSIRRPRLRRLGRASRSAG